ncbi:MAG: 23S rRNA (adenine(2503)-C(2))-methyltransferase RlmN [Planctomycetes bacterium]|nr:23S rRNA (adenine(2503)-C(2))-methyltransferase RlmN [Planctomycetota bacterium]
MTTDSTLPAQLADVSTSAALLPRILDLTPSELTDWVVTRGWPKFRAGQLQKWLFVRRATSFEQMTDLPKPMREQLAAEFRLFSAEVESHQVASDRTEKLLLKLADGETIECVLMREPDRVTVCISTQVGCAMGCVFCASGMLGLKRNLSAGEILEELLRMQTLLGPDERITNIVVMGIGEPLANMPAVLQVLAAASSPDGLGIGARHITVSTVGLPAKIREFAHSGKQYNLAISLHAPNNTLRDKLVPVNDRIGVDAILDAADEYFEVTGRRVTFEYVLLAQVNDEPQHAQQLAQLLRGRCAHVNLIPMNGVSVLPFHEPPAPRTQQFVAILEHAGIPASVRKRKGADIDAACGQLRLKHEKS